MSSRRNSSEETSIADAINKIADEVNSVLNEKRESEYFESILLLHSLVENLLKWLVYTKTIWEKSAKLKEISDEEFKLVRSHCKGLTYHGSLQIAFLTDLVDNGLYGRIRRVKGYRNDMIHQLWMYAHRGDFQELRRRLEELAGVANELVGISNRLTQEVGVDEIWDLSLRN